MVLTPAGEGLPVAWAISSREDEAAVSTMIGGLRHVVEELGYQFPAATYFMSDKAMAFFKERLGRRHGSAGRPAPAVLVTRAARLEMQTGHVSVSMCECKCRLFPLPF